MPWKIAGFTALVFGRAVHTLPQGEFGDLLWPELDVPELSDPELITWTTYHTEPASTSSRVEHVTSSSLLHQLSSISSSATQVATPIVKTQALSHLTPTSRPSIHTSEGHSTQTSIRVTSTSPNTILPASQTLSPPAELSQRHGHADVWRVVGIAVIAVSVVGTTILAVVFFDQWWSFLCDVCGRRKKRRKYGKEELVPDWERGSWVFRTEGNSPAYPSFGSPPARQTVEEVASQAQSPRHPRTSSNIPPAPILRENSQRTNMRGSMYGTSGGNFGRLSPSNGVTMHTPHYTLSRSDTQRTATSEDAYDGLAAD